MKKSRFVVSEGSDIEVLHKPRPGRKPALVSADATMYCSASLRPNAGRRSEGRD